MGLNTDFQFNFFKTITPVKITECGSLKMNSRCWGLLSDYYLESVKINCYKANIITSAAILKVTDVSGQVTCVLKGPTIGLLFGLNAEEWIKIEKLCHTGQQLFYRYFKDGLSKNFSCEQKLFYNFCLKNQKDDIFVAIFTRNPNLRTKDKDTPLVNILELKKCTSDVMNLYTNYLRSKS